MQTESDSTKGAGWILALLGAVLLTEAAWRVWLGFDFLLPPMETGWPMVAWRQLDQFVGWIALLILAYADQQSNAAEPRRRVLLRWVLAAGIAGMIGSLFWSNFASRATVEIIVAGLLALTATIIGLRQLSAFARSLAKGITIAQLWRLVAMQWMLLWVAAEVILRWKYRSQGIAAHEAARSLLYALPAFGLMPNVLMAVGIDWWAKLRGTAAPRQRAWLVALLTFNLGAIGAVAGSVGFHWLAVFAAAPLALGIGMYLLGFPRRAWAGIGRLVPLALIALLTGALLCAADQLSKATGQPLSWQFSVAWRLLVGSAACTLWLAGMAGMALRKPPAPDQQA